MLADEMPIESAGTPVLIPTGRKVETGYDNTLDSLHGGFIAWSTATMLSAGSQIDIYVAGTGHSVLHA